MRGPSQGRPLFQVFLVRQRADHPKPHARLRRYMLLGRLGGGGMGLVFLAASASADSRFLATAEGKTTRVWRIPNGSGRPR